MSRKIFRNLIDKDEARSIFYKYAPRGTKGSKTLSLADALGEVLYKDVFASIDVPPFDRASMDGFAIHASDVVLAEEDQPVLLQVVGELKAGYVYGEIVEAGTAVEISTGAPLPAGADSVVMVEYTERNGDQVSIFRPTTPGENVMSAGSDIQLGERVLSSHSLLTSIELGVLAALGVETLEVVDRPTVGIFSSGDEIVPSGTSLKPGKLYDINSTSIAAVTRENGGMPTKLGILMDKRDEIEQHLADAITQYDLVVISGGTSAGMGDILYRVVDELGEPGLLVHGVKVKPGKPTILAVCNGTPIVGLPGYPASALSIYSYFIIPYLRERAGLGPQRSGQVIKAKTKQRLRSVRGRHQFKPMYLLRGNDGWIAFPVPGGSGAITSVALADGIVEIPEDMAFIGADTEIEVTLISEQIRPPDLQIIGSHDIVLACIVSAFETVYPQYHVRSVTAGSRGGVSAIRRGEAHVAGVHLLDSEKGYNTWLVDEVEVEIIPGYLRMQGLMVAPGNPKGITTIEDLFREDVRMINRNPGSGTRILFDAYLEEMHRSGSEIKGYDNFARSHNSAAEAVRSGLVDVAIGIKAASTGLDFIELREEEYDLIVSREYLELESVQKFIEFLGSDEVKAIVEGEDGYQSKV